MLHSLEAAVDVVVIDLLGCALPRAGSRVTAHAHKHTAPPVEQLRASYSLFDLLAGCGSSFLTNLCITIAVPMALSSAESRGHPAPLASSGLVGAVAWVGMSLSVLITFCLCTRRYVDGKTPFYLFATLLLLGNLAFLAAEWFGWPLTVLLGARFVMALGFGASFTVKRRASVEADPRRRTTHFMHIELCNSIGSAAGPILAGAFAVLLPRGAYLWPPLMMLGLASAYLVAIAHTRLDAPLPPPREGALAPPRLSERSPLADDGGGGDGGGGGGDDDDGGGGASVRDAAIVQATCLTFGVGRNFLRGAFESAMVVVYDRQYFFSQGSAGLLAGCCALSTVAALLLYKARAGSTPTSRLLLLAEAGGLGSVLLMLATALTPTSHSAAVHASSHSLASAASLTHADAPPALLAMALTIGASLLFYPAMYLGAAIGNSHPLRYAIEGHPLLSKGSMIAQQEVLQTTLGKGLGMILGRVALGDPPRLASLGRLFLVVLLLLAACLALGFEPARTRAAWRRLRG